MKDWENSVADRAADRAGKHGKEGSKKDIAADKAGLAKMRAAAGKTKKGKK